MSGRRLSNTAVQPRRRSSASQKDIQIAQQLLAQSSNRMWSNNQGKSVGLLPGRQTWGPVILMTTGPIFIFMFVYTISNNRGSVKRLWKELRENGFVSQLCHCLPNCKDAISLRIIGCLVCVQLLFSLFLPGENVQGAITPSGSSFAYIANGMSCFILTALCYLLGVVFNLYSGGVLWTHYSNTLGSFSVLAIILSLLFYCKGLFAPNSQDSGSSGNIWFDLYWGTELHPRVLNLDLKQFITGRLAMTYWGLLIMSSFFKQREVVGFNSRYHFFAAALFTSAVLQLLYVTKFYAWEVGYLHSFDMQHDRLGFYKVWGSLVFLPAVYCSPLKLLIPYFPKYQAPPLICLVSFLIGLLCIYATYEIDSQKCKFRALNGQMKVWGKDPYFITAKFKTETGDGGGSNLLLGSGWWGVSRHFHYVTELGAFVCWTVPVWSKQLFAWFPVMFLAIFLLDRAYRVEASCLSKYGHYWIQYKSKITDMITPTIR